MLGIKFGWNGHNGFLKVVNVFLRCHYYHLPLEMEVIFHLKKYSQGCYAVSLDQNDSVVLGEISYVDILFSLYFNYHPLEKGCGLSKCLHPMMR